MQPALRVLAVDDDETFCRNVAKLLNSRGVQADVAFSGRDALKRLAQPDGKYGIVLLDVRMPHMDGLEVLRRIKSRFSQIEVIILTGFADVDCGVEAIRQGAFDFIMKPCDIEELTERVSAAGDLNRIRRQPLLWPRTCAGELILTFFVDLYPDDSLSRAFDMLCSRRTAGTLFVVDRQRRLQGLVTREALLETARAAQPQVEMTWDFLLRHPDALPSGTVAQIMQGDVLTARPETPLEELAESMLQRRLRSMPVVGQGSVIGIVRLRDVLHYLNRDEYGQSE